MLLTELQVVVFHLKSGELVRWGGDAMREEAFDEFLDTMAVLEAVNER